MESGLIKELVSLLSGVELILQLHRTMYSDLSHNLTILTPSTRLGEIFVKLVFTFYFLFYYFYLIFSEIFFGTNSSNQGLYLKTYFQYVNHYQIVVQWLANRKNDKLLQKTLEGLKPDPFAKGIKDYMIMPIQKIPRYRLFLSVHYFPLPPPPLIFFHHPIFPFYSMDPLFPSLSASFICEINYFCNGFLHLGTGD